MSDPRLSSPSGSDAAELLQNAPDGAFRADLDGRLLEVNAAFERLTGFPRAELIGVPHDAFTPPEYRDLEARLAQSVVETGAPAGYDKEYLRKDGTRVPAWVSLFLVHGRGERHLAAIVRDLSARRDGEQARRHIQRIESLRVLARGVAHDFNNVLGTVVGHLTFVDQALPTEGPTRDLLGRAQAGIRRASGLVEQLLLYSGSGEHRAEATDLGILILEQRPELESALAGRAQLRYELAPDLRPVHVDRAQLRQLLMNLATNAGEAMTGRGTVTVRTALRSVTREDRARWSRTGTLLPEGPYAVIEVDDDGCGMSEEILARAFDPFYSTKFVGRGLGLATALGVARAHRGGIDAASRPGAGTKITVLLPIGVTMAAGPQARPGTAALTGTVLLVEDEPDILSFAEYVLRSSGFVVLSAVDGPGAIELFRTHRESIRLVVLDFSMPRMSGAETFDRLREIDPRVRVLLTSGYSTQDATAGFASGVLAGFLHKPYDHEVLVTKVRECLG